MEDLKCPYCNTKLNICHDDGFGYEEDVFHKIRCGNCGKMFVFTAMISYHYTPQKADCLNGEIHNWKLVNTYPIEFSTMKCSYCGEERELTDKERINFSIKSKQSYFDLINV